MKEIEKQNFGSLLKGIMWKCDLNALVIGDNTEIIPDEKVKR